MFNELSAKAYRLAMIQWLVESDLDHFVTFNINRQVKPRMAQKLIAAWCARVDHASLGRGWSKKPTEARTLMVGFCENIETNIHYHTMMRMPQGVPVTLKQMDGFWRSVCPSGQLDASIVRNAMAVGHYVTKQLALPQGRETFFVSAEWQRR